MTNNLSTSKLVNVTRTKDALTANMAITHSTSLSNVVDMFFIAGASRTMSEESIQQMFARAFAENPLLAIKCIFWARDIRGGAGERRFFRICWDYILRNNILSNENIACLDMLIPEYGRWDDVWAGYTELDNYRCDWIARQLTEAQNGLCAKWLPRKGGIFNSIRKYMRLTPKEFRKLIVGLSNTVEQKMCAKEYSAIEYAHVPSVAMHKYRKAFLKNDEGRFNMFLSDVEEGKQKIHADAIFPHTIVKEYLVNGSDTDRSMEAQWKALPNYMEGSKERILPICDVSGSMESPDMLPLSVSVALGLYISERNDSIFKDAFITFSGTPEMQFIQPGSLFSRVNQLKKAEWGMNTNLQATFKLILNKAIEARLTQDDMPTKILIISDMEFDSATNNYGYGNRGGYEGTNFEHIEFEYRKAGYQRPQIVFWNVNGRSGNCPIQIGTAGTALVSGFSPSILKEILAGELVSPEAFVYRVLNSERYNAIKL